MADRPIWRGHLRLALVSCPVALYTAHRETANLHFKFINPATGNRVRMVTLDSQTDQELQRRDLARGYQFEKDQYVLLDDEDFEKARIESSSTLNVDKFVTADSIDPVYFDTSYYMAPAGDSAQDVYVVLRDAIRQSGSVALSRIVLSRRERAVAVMPMGKGLILHTLYETRDIADPARLFESVPSDKPDADMVKLATQLIDRQAAKFEPTDLEDRYEARLREVIDAKIKGAGFKPAAEPQERGNVIDLMAALKRSLGQTDSAPSGKAKTAAAKPEAKAAPAKKPVKAPDRTPAPKAPTRKRAG
jgi:DNA end-binding protein Ku